MVGKSQNGPRSPRTFVDKHFWKFVTKFENCNQNAPFEAFKFIFIIKN